MNERHYKPGHLAALRRFAVAITVLNLLGHLVLGFEQSFAQPLVALATAYSLQIVLESLEAWSMGRRPRFAGGPLALVDSLLSAHITALAVAMLLYFNDRLWVVAFATAVAIGSKAIFRVPVGEGTRHIFNPSNFGITTTLLVFPWVSPVAPYHFTENVSGAGDWLLPALIFVLGSYLNGCFTKRLPLIAAWLGGFVLQALVRSVLFQRALVPSLAPMTGVAFVLFTFYMVPDPATTPERPWGQVAFGGAVAAAYGIFVALHIPCGLFFALTVVCAARGLAMSALSSTAKRRPIAGGDAMTAN